MKWLFPNLVTKKELITALHFRDIELEHLELEIRRLTLEVKVLSGNQSITKK